MRHKVQSGFTLVELLVVVAVIAILAALLLPVLSRAKATAKRTICINNLRQINLGVRMYSDDSHDASPSSGGTNFASLYFGYKALIKHYVGLNGASSSRDKLFACPADELNPSTMFTNYITLPTKPYGRIPVNFVHKSLHDESIWSYSSYAFNGGDNVTRTFRSSPDSSPRQWTNGFPGLTGIKLSSVKHPNRTVLVAELVALQPYSWHDPRYGDALLYNDSKNVVSFVDGHVSYIKMYLNLDHGFINHGISFWYNPPDSYGYQWTPD